MALVYEKSREYINTEDGYTCHYQALVQTEPTDLKKSQLKQTQHYTSAIHPNFVTTSANYTALSKADDADKIKLEI